jgi:hypothetical protein
MTITEANKVVADNLIRIIHERKLDQGMIAKACGLDSRKMSDMLHGRKLIKAADIVAIIRTIEGVDANDLFSSVG